MQPDQRKLRRGGDAAVKGAAWALAFVAAPAAGGASHATDPIRTLPSYPLYDPAPTSPAWPETVETFNGTKFVVNVSAPSLIPVLPPAGRANGAAVIIAPGGAYFGLAIDIEGFDEARWLASRGITVFVLKYRLHPVPGGDVAAVTKEMAANPPPAGQSAYVTYDLPAAVADAAAAVRFVRAHAADWRVDPKRVGMLGFSAGAITALKVATGPATDARPDFLGAVYPPLERLTAPADAPPLFGAIALDDGRFAGYGFGLIEAWQQARRPVEFHLYERGGHGFGMGREGTTTTAWLDAFYRWLEMRKIVIADAAR